jgi:hypothetical protein
MHSYGDILYAILGFLALSGAIAGAVYGLISIPKLLQLLHAGLGGGVITAPSGH